MTSLLLSLKHTVQALLLSSCPPGHWVGNLHLLGQSQPWMLSERINRCDEDRCKVKLSTKGLLSSLGSTFWYLMYIKHLSQGREYWPSKGGLGKLSRGKHKHFWLLLQLKNKFKKLLWFVSYYQKITKSRPWQKVSNYTKMLVATAGNSSGTSLTQAVNSTVYEAQQAGKISQMNSLS